MLATAIASDSVGGLAPLLAGLDGLAHGVAVMDALGRIKYANAAARMVMTALGWGDDGQDEWSISPAPARQWADALNRVCQRGLRELLQLPQGDDCRYAALTPVSAQGECFAFITFGRSELCGPVELQMFSQHCGLTLAEGMVLRQLCRGLTAVQIAKAHGVATCTVLTQIAAIRNKTLSKSVRELLDSLSRMPPLMTVGMQHTRAAMPTTPTCISAPNIRRFQPRAGLVAQAH
jgi:DNA-binding CsgD family transcriptional regulator